jgi:hypothetical protein
MSSLLSRLICSTTLPLEPCLRFHINVLLPLTKVQVHLSQCIHGDSNQGHGRSPDSHTVLRPTSSHQL